MIDLNFGNYAIYHKFGHKLESINPKIVLVISGPTGIGKSDLAEQLSLQYQAPIISCDSRQMYRRMDIGTAKPSKEKQAIFPYYFINNLELTDHYNAGMFERDALTTMTQLFKQHHIIICCGGTGLYIKAILDGLDEFPAIDPQINTALINEYESYGIAHLQEELVKKDPAYAAKVDLQNPRRLLRALSVIRSSGKTFSSFLGQNKKVREFKVIGVRLLMNRSKLYERINKRVDLMLSNGLVQEVSSLKEFHNYQSMQSVGYQELISFLKGGINYEEAIRLIKRNSRRYAKRQLTWLNKYGFGKAFDIEQKDLILSYINSRINEYMEAEGKH